MFIGREKELLQLKKLYLSNKFEMLIVHGRRRVGKSYLLSHFCEEIKNYIYFTADKDTEFNNAKRFSKLLANKLNKNYISSFSSWNEIYDFFESYEFSEKLVIVIDEFTYLTYQDVAYESKLQNAIDRILKNKNILLVLCGSEVSTIENIINNASHPLYGRKTSEMKIMPFNYYEIVDFFPNYSYQEIIETYMILGGIPLYLSIFNKDKSLKENIIENILSTNGYLYKEVETCLKMELNEPYLYLSILNSIKYKKLNLNDISTLVNENNAKVNKYLRILTNLSIIKKEKPVGEKENARNTLYSIEDNFFAFYFTFVYEKEDMLNGLISADKFYDLYLKNDQLMTYFGRRFERVCLQYVIKQSYEGKLPFYIEMIGSWWGNNKKEKKQEEIDIVGLSSSSALIGEVKYTNNKFDIKEFNDLVTSSYCIDKENKYLYAFSKSGFTNDLIKENKCYLIDIEKLFM